MLNRIISPKGKRSLLSLLTLSTVFFIVGFSSGEVSIKNIALNESPEIGFTSLSPNGLLGGEIIPASCESGNYHDAPDFGTACTASSVCGQAYGTIGCGGVCSVAAPSVPINYGQSCSSSNICGSNQGTIVCDGSCSAIAPAVPSNYGRVCLVSNVCGQSNQGTIGCDGTCTVKEAPALPSGYGTPCQSGTNSCGQKATGIIGCGGSCTAVTPSDSNCTTCPLPNGNGVCNTAENNSNCPADCPYVAPATPTAPAGEGAIWTPATEWTLTASPNPIFANTRTTVSWSVSGATGCTLVGVGAVSGKETDRFVGGPALDYQSSKLQENTDFTLTCSNAYSGRKDSKTVRVNVRTIKVQEF
ncbi:MAG: hypothetical protein WC724_03495 [Candidatus Paceibacterota bacterium]|jgi:hypothetical protein